MHDTQTQATENSGTNKLGDGEPEFCERCGSAYREIQRLPGTVGYCPTCFEDVLNGSAEDA